MDQSSGGGGSNEAASTTNGANGNNIGGNTNAAAPGPSIGRQIINSLMNVAMMYLLYTWWTGGFSRAGAGSGSGNTGGSSPSGALRPVWREGDIFQISGYLSEDAVFRESTAKLVWEEKDVIFSWSDENGVRSKQLEVDLTSNVQNNGSLYAHVFLYKSGAVLDSADPNYDRSKVLYGSHPVIKFLPKPRKRAERNLLSADLDEDIRYAEAAAASLEPSVIVGFWKPNVTVNLMLETSDLWPSTIPAPVAPLMRYSSDGRGFLPVLFFNDFWIYREHMTLINETTSRLPLSFEFGYLSLFRLTMYLQMEESFNMQSSIGISNEGDPDEFKRMITDNNPILLGLTLVVSILHSVFDFLAFKNDIAFWKNKKSVEGLSVRSIFVNCFFQLMIFLYLFDNETSWLVLGSVFVGLLIECWKITKATDVTVNGEFPFIHVADKPSYASTTREYDQQAVRVLSYICYPLLIGYAIYSLMYSSHKSWYSWILGSVVGAIYMFGFITMTPQLFINYKLKSVAHLPWRTFVYKALNTFIDDLFAFIIKMPTLHRLACLRDDVIFLIFLYQRWIYPVDMTRTNEFGQNFTDEASEQVGVAQEGGTVIVGDKKKD